MDLYLYNSLNKKKEKFVPIKKGQVTMYTCGPTVYSYAHIGNMSAYLMADVLIRLLELLGYTVKQVKNITDVGHLVSDSDEGEDKMEREAKKQNKTPEEIARFYTEAYIRDENLLHMKEPFARPRATEYIQDMLEQVKLLVEKGYAYETSDGIYMDVTKIPNYGKLSGNTVEELDAGARVEVNTEKKHPADFAVWKKAEANHIQQWDSPWGKSFPGWHLECSTMAWAYFHDTYDIKTGGEDNIFPHHECEIAQTRAIFGKQLAHYFIHKRHIRLNGMKMAKSEGNIVNVQDLIQRGYTPETIRLALISSHYRNHLNFQDSLLEEAQKNIEKVNHLIQELYTVNGKGITFHKEEYKERFLTALCDDMNMSEALASLFDLLKLAYTHQKSLSQENAQDIIETLQYMNEILPCFHFGKKTIDVPEEVNLLLEEREKARKNKDFSLADSLRDKIIQMGYQIVDSKEGVKVEKL